MNDVYPVLVEPYEGYGRAFVWGVYSTEQKAKEVLRTIAEKHNLELFDDVAYNLDEPSMKNRYEKASFQHLFMND